MISGMSNTQWEKNLALMFHEIEEIPDPYERLIVAEAARAMIPKLLDDLVDQVTYSLRAQTGDAYEALELRTLTPARTIRQRIQRYCFRTGLPKPPLRRFTEYDKEFVPPPSVIDLRHLNTHEWRRLRGRGGSPTRSRSAPDEP